MKLKVTKQEEHYILKQVPDKKFYIDILNEDTPCDGCIHVQKCGAKRLACDAFALYVHRGDVNWDLPRLPTRRTYTQAMSIGDGESILIRNINKKLKERAEV